MAIRSLGVVTVASAGTPVRATNNQSTSSAHFGIQSISIQVLGTNTGKVYIGASNLVKATLVGAFMVLPAPGSGASGALPVFTSVVLLSPEGLDAKDFWIDVDNNGEGVLVSVTEQ